jgi:hypothetical protein
MDTQFYPELVSGVSQRLNPNILGTNILSMSGLSHLQIINKVGDEKTGCFFIKNR